MLFSILGKGKFLAKGRDFMKENKINIDEIKDIVEEESKSQFQNKSAIHKYLLNDPPPGSQNYASYLGINPEKVIFSYTFEELDKPSTYKLIAEKMADHEVKKVVIHSDLTVEGISRIIKEAQKQELPFTIVKAPEFKGDIGLELIRN